MRTPVGIPGRYLRSWGGGADDGAVADPAARRRCVTRPSRTAWAPIATPSPSSHLRARRRCPARSAPRRRAGPRVDEGARDGSPRRSSPMPPFRARARASRGRAPVRSSSGRRRSAAQIRLALGGRAGGRPAPDLSGVADVAPTPAWAIRMAPAPSSTWSATPTWPAEHRATADAARAGRCPPGRRGSRARPTWQLWATCTRLSILLPRPITVSPRRARSTVVLAPISTSSSTRTLPTCGILPVRAARRRRSRSRRLPSTAPGWTITRWPSGPVARPRRGDAATTSSPSLAPAPTKARAPDAASAPTRAPRLDHREGPDRRGRDRPGRPASTQAAGGRRARDRRLGIEQLGAARSSAVWGAATRSSAAGSPAGSAGRPGPRPRASARPRAGSAGLVRNDTSSGPAGLERRDAADDARGIALELGAERRRHLPEGERARRVPPTSWPSWRRRRTP